MNEIYNESLNKPLETLVTERKISKKTLERVKITKSFIEKKYNLKNIQSQSKNKEWKEIYSFLNKQNLSQNEKNEIINTALQQESKTWRKHRTKLSINQFESISIIGKGSFGEIRVCRHKQTNKIYAIKKMKKELTHIKNNLIFHIRTERDILSTNSNNPRITQLRYSFQDEKYLYLAMDFIQGGDLMNLLNNKDTLTENEARFYIAEIILCVNSVHEMGCIHRDIKPDNILIDNKGHLKLSDFGLSIISEDILFPLSYKNRIKKIKHFNTYNNNDKDIFLRSKTYTDSNLQNLQRPNRITAFSSVGTPDYVAPEIFTKKGYGKEVDWWSVGIIFYEMLFGYPPFFSSTPLETFKKIKNFQQTLVIPNENVISPNAINLIKSFLTTANLRLGINGIEEIKAHPFFEGFPWNNIYSLKPPFVPDLESDYDTKYFDKYEEEKDNLFNNNDLFSNISQEHLVHERSQTENKLFGFTFNRDIEDEINQSKIFEYVQTQTEQKILNKSSTNDFVSIHNVSLSNTMTEFIPSRKTKHKKIYEIKSKSSDVNIQKRKRMNVVTPIKNMEVQKIRNKKNTNKKILHTSYLIQNESNNIKDNERINSDNLSFNGNNLKKCNYILNHKQNETDSVLETSSSIPSKSSIMSSTTSTCISNISNTSVVKSKSIGKVTKIKKQIFFIRRDKHIDS